MSGERENYFFVEHGVVRTNRNSYGGASLPDLLLGGEQDIVSWLRQVTLENDRIWESSDCAGSLLVNMDTRTVIMGFLRWDSEMTVPQAFEGLRDYHYFHRYADLQAAYHALFTRVWPGWTLALAKKNSFGVQECVRTEVEDVSLILPTKKKARNPNLHAPEKNFLLILEFLLRPEEMARLRP